MEILNIRISPHLNAIVVPNAGGDYLIYFQRVEIPCLTEVESVDDGRRGDCRSIRSSSRHDRRKDGQFVKVALQAASDPEQLPVVDDFRSRHRREALPRTAPKAAATRRQTNLSAGMETSLQRCGRQQHGQD